MHPATVTAMLLGFASFGVGWLTSGLADITADALRRNGHTPPTTPGFYFISRNPTAIGVLPSFRRLYSNLHRDYDSSFITWCVHIARWAFPLAALFISIAVIIAVWQK